MEFKCLPKPEENIQVHPDILVKHLSETNGKIRTRFPPEPNGYLHIGHAKACFINFTFAKISDGTCNLRFDDTNPSKEKQEYIDSILNDVQWLGHNPDRILYTSDYFDIMYEKAEELILQDKAYVCELSETVIKEQRHDGIESIYRNRPVEESLKLFREMKDGKHLEGSMVLRMKCDMNSDNCNMRDLVAYRIIFKEHPRTGNKWVIYPTYDFSHSIADSIENITHSLCSTEFQTRNELYRWVPETLNMYAAPQIEYARLKITHTMLSKRKLIEIVNDKIVDGWDDPRMPTIQGLRRKGFTPNSINTFCSKIGCLSTTEATVEYELLEECLRHDLDQISPRAMAVFDPLEVIISNLDVDKKVLALDYPNLKEHSTSHEINISAECKTVYIERSDFKMKDEPKYFRLAPNKIVRLKYLGLVRCLKYDISDFDSSRVSKVYVELLPDDYKPEKRVQGTINWASLDDCVMVEIRKYSHLFPKHPIKNNWKSSLNLQSKEVMNVMVDSSVKNAKHFDKFQFERIGYFSVDPDSKPDNLVMNLSVSLKEDKNK